MYISQCLYQIQLEVSSRSILIKIVRWGNKQVETRQPETSKSATQRMYTCLKMPPPTTIYSYAFHELQNNFPYLLMFMLFNHVIKIMSFIFLYGISSQVTIVKWIKVLLISTHWILWFKLMYLCIPNVISSVLMAFMNILRIIIY